MDTWNEPRSDPRADIERVKVEVSKLSTFEERCAGDLPSLERHLEDMYWQRWARDPSPFPAKSERWDEADPVADLKAMRDYSRSDGPQRELERATRNQGRYEEGFDFGYDGRHCAPGGSTCSHPSYPSRYEDLMFWLGHRDGRLARHLSGGK